MSTTAESDHDAQVAFEKKLKDEQRLCHMVKRPDFDGYGFNLHSEKGKPGQYIGKVDEKSPAEQSGLRQGDRIIEVNGVNIGSETHKQVVQRIKAIENEVRLLVIDPDIEQRLKQQHYQDMSLSSSSKTVESSTSSTASAATTTTMRNSNNNSHSSQASSPTTSLKTSTKQLNNNNDPNRTSSPDHQMSSSNGAGAPSSPSSAQKTSFDGDNNTMSHSTTMQNGTTTSNGKSSSTKTTANSSAAAVVGNPSVSGGLNLKMTAAEMRAKLQARKKYDPKNDSVDLRKKFDIIQKL